MKGYSSFDHLQQSLLKGETSCVNIVSYYLKQADTHKHLNAFIEVYNEEALAHAKLVDEKIKQGTAGKLAGMVIGNKDVLNHKGHFTTSASKVLSGYRSIYNATAVQRLLDEDAIIIGRCNCDEFAMGSSNENSAYGNVKNGLDETKVPGGSSGGSAVAVQMDMCTVALGTDTGGSIRQPASFCGIYGIKPTYGRVSRYGLTAYASSFDQIGVFTHNVEDMAVVLEVMSGKDEMDATSSSEKKETYSSSLNFDGKVKLAYYPEAIDHPKLDKEIGEGFHKLFSALKEKGHAVNAAPFDMLDALVPVYYLLTTAEASSNLARFDGIRYGHRSEVAGELDTIYKRNRSEGFGKEVKRRIMLGTFVLSAGYYDAYYSKAQKARRVVREKTEAILKDNDFIIIPTTPSTAFGIGEKMLDPVEMYLADIFTVQAPIAGLPAISIPLGKHSNGMPYGVQLIGSRFSEGKMMAFSKYLMESIGTI